MRFLYQYQCVNFNKNIDCEKIQYRKTKNEYRRSGKFFFGNKGHYKICGLEEINQVRVSFSKSSIFMYLNSLEKLSDEEVKKYFVGKFFNLGNDEADNMQMCKECAIYY